MKLHLEFERLMHERPTPKDLLGRLWRYAKWSSDHPDREVQDAVYRFFFENLKETRNAREVCLSFMTPEEFKQYFETDAPSLGGKRR
ncbi:hypothetical protein ACXR0O_23480 [Verrucomicrobiota bacterium sgz303538]